MRPERLLAVALSLALAACAGAPSSRSSGPPSKEQDAAALQVKLGQEYLAKGELETAQEKLRRAIDLNPQSVDALRLVGPDIRHQGERALVARGVDRRPITAEPLDDVELRARAR